MNKIMVVARGKNIDTYKIISSLQSMILDSSKEIVSSFYANDMEFNYRNLFGTNYHDEDNTFMAQIVEKGKETYPLHFSYKNKDMTEPVEMVICGVFDEEQVKSSNTIEKNFEDEEIRNLMNSDIKNFPKYICDASNHESIEWCFRGIDSTMIVYRLSHYPYCVFFSYGKTGCYIGEKNDVEYYSNSKEVLENMGIKCVYFQRFYTRDGGGTEFSVKNEEENRPVFKSGFDILKENFEKEISAIDDPRLRKKILKEFEKVVKYYKSLLRARSKTKIFTNKNKNEDN